MAPSKRDQNLLAQQELDLKRYRDALARNAIAGQTVDDQEKLVLQTRGTVKNDQGVVRGTIEVQLDYCHITSPISGQVGLRLVDPGNVVQAGRHHHITGGDHTKLEPITVIFTAAGGQPGRGPDPAAQPGDIAGRGRWTAPRNTGSGPER